MITEACLPLGSPAACTGPKFCSGLPSSPEINCSLSGVLGLNATHMGKHFCFLAHWHRLASHVGTYIQRAHLTKVHLIFIISYYSGQTVFNNEISGWSEYTSLQQVSQDSVKRYLSEVSKIKVTSIRYQRTISKIP